MHIYTKCSNYASDTCPCVLAENGHCIVCSMCNGKDFCECTDTVSFCIMQELKNNGGKAKEPHHVMKCEVAYVKNFGDTLRFMRIKVPQGNPEEYKRIGAYIFIRVKENTFFDVPISVMFEDYENDTIALIIQIRGIKTSDFKDIKKGDTVFVRGPYYNCIQGNKHVVSLHNGKASVFCRGIGFLPSLHVIDVLRKNGSDVTVYLDEGQFDNNILKFFTDLFEINFHQVRMCTSDGNLTEEIRSVINDDMEHGANLIHLGMSDYLIKQYIDYIQSRNTTAAVSCINNSQICCGEGICGACTRNTGSNKTIHLCKEQLSLDELKKIL